MEITLDIEILPASHPTALEFEARLFGEHIGFFDTYQRARQAALNLAAARKGGAEKELPTEGGRRASEQTGAPPTVQRRDDEANTRTGQDGHAISESDHLD
jgi:hypothetical protein